MPEFSGLRAPDRRIMVVTGHYGSGKTEFCVSLAMRLARMPETHGRTVLRRAQKNSGPAVQQVFPRARCPQEIRARLEADP
jgi:predicted ATPase